MSEIDFQNGFVCGMATKGLTVVGKEYEPIVWNDAGVYTHFYIDFKRSLLPFSTGMLSESIIVHDSVQVPISNFIKVSPGVYKIFADIKGKTKGITVLNKVSTYLLFSDSSKVNPFSVFFFVNGLDKYERLGYLFEQCEMVLEFTGAEIFNSDSWENLELASITESAVIGPYSTLINEVINLILT